MCIRKNMDLIYINAYTKFYQNSSICSADIEEKPIFISIKGHNSVVYKGCLKIIETIAILSKRLNIILNNLHSHQVLHIWGWIISLLSLMVMIQ